MDPAAWLKRRGPRPASPPSGASGRADTAGGHDPREARGVVRPLSRGERRVLDGEEYWRGSRAISGREPRGPVQICRPAGEIKKKYGSIYTVPEQVVDGAGMIERSDVLVGMGGTMTTEAALLGVPAISAFQGAELYTERYLLSKGLLLKARSAAAVSRSGQGRLEPGYGESYRRRARTCSIGWTTRPQDHRLPRGAPAFPILAVARYNVTLYFHEHSIYPSITNKSRPLPLRDE